MSKENGFSGYEYSYSRFDYLRTNVDVPASDVPSHLGDRPELSYVHKKLKEQTETVEETDPYYALARLLTSLK